MKHFDEEYSKGQQQQHQRIQSEHSLFEGTITYVPMCIG